MLAAVLGVSRWRAGRRTSATNEELRRTTQALEQARLQQVDTAHQAAKDEAQREHEERVGKVDTDLPGAIDDALERAKQRRSPR